MNSDFIAHSSFYHLQKDPNETSIQRVPLKLIDGGLRYKEIGYIRKGTPQKEGNKHFPRKKKTSVRTENYPVK